MGGVWSGVGSACRKPDLERTFNKLNSHKYADRIQNVDLSSDLQSVLD